MVTRTKEFPIGVETVMWFHDPLPADKVRRLPRNHRLRTTEETGDVGNVGATIEVKVKEGSPLAANLDELNVSFVDLDPPEFHDEVVEFIWDELAKGHTVEMKLIWPSDDELKKEVERERKIRRWNLERAVAVRSDDLLKKRKKRKR